jgi:glycosyltransferase involved in cell wall biosynthesis
MKLSYLITVHNETDTLGKLLERLIKCRYDEDEIVILDDFSDNTTTKEILRQVSLRKNIKVLQHALSNNYGAHKNYGNEHCTGDWVFQIDSDELPPELLLFNLRDILASNPNVELIYVPRINDYRGVTPAHASQWGWRLTPSPSCNNRPVVNWPDYQSRLYVRVPGRIRWDRRLHEKIEGHTEYSFLPADEELALYHDKTIDKQLQTNKRYNKDFSEDDNKGHKVI